MSSEGEQILEDYAEAKREVDAFQGLLSEAMEFSLPQLDTFNNPDSRGQKKGSRVFDSTATLGLLEQAAQNQGGLVPPMEEWCEFDIPLAQKRTLTKPQQDDLAKHLQEEQTIFFEYMHNSNFDVQINPAMLLAGVSTGPLMVHEGDEDEAFNFETVPLEKIVPVQGPYGCIETVYRSWKCKASMLQRLWPKASWSEDMKRRISEKAKDIEVVDGVIYDPDKKTYSYRVVENSTKHVAFQTDGDRTSPWICFRIYACAGEVLGRGPVIWHLSDIKTTNKIEELDLRNAALAALGIYQYDDDGVVNPDLVQLTPGALLPRMQGASGLVPLDRSGDFQMVQLKLQDLRQNIREGLLNVTLPALTGPTKSATEVAAQLSQARSKITPPMSRLYRELVIPLVRRCRDILERKKILAPLEIGGMRLKVIPISPLAKLAQKAKRADIAQAIVTVAAADPGLPGRVMDLTGWAREELAQGGVTKTLLYTEDQIRANDARKVQEEQLRAFATALPGAQAAIPGGATGLVPR